MTDTEKGDGKMPKPDIPVLVWGLSLHPCTPPPEAKRLGFPKEIHLGAPHWNSQGQLGCFPPPAGLSPETGR